MFLLVGGLSFGWVCNLSLTIIFLKLRGPPSKFVSLLVVQCPFRQPHCKLPGYFNRCSAKVGSYSTMLIKILINLCGLPTEEKSSISANKNNSYSLVLMAINISTLRRSQTYFFFLLSLIIKCRKLIIEFFIIYNTVH